MLFKHEIKHFIKITKFACKNILKRKIPIYIPVYESNILKGRIALITGATSGIGYSIADSFCKNGCTVIITGRNKNKLQMAKEKLEKENSKARVYENILDLSDIKSFESRLKEIIEKIGNKNIDILVNNAGISARNYTLENNKIEEYDAIMDCNLKGTFFLSNIVIKYMEKNKIKGNILNIGSSSGNRPAIDPYAISKWGIRGLTLGMAKKYIDNDIIVNGISPGPTATKMMKDEEDEDISRLQYPMDRFVTPEEVANLAVFLVSDMGRTIVGQTIYMSSGLGVITFDDADY